MERKYGSTISGRHLKVETDWMDSVDDVSFEIVLGEGEIKPDRHQQDITISRGSAMGLVQQLCAAFGWVVEYQELVEGSYTVRSK